MKIFRHKKSKKLYTIEWVNPPKMTGSWYEATPYKWEGKTRTATPKYPKPDKCSECGHVKRQSIRHVDSFKEFKLVSER